MTSAALRQWREQRGLTQAQAALQIGCSRRALQQWESGASAIPPYIAMAVSAVSMGLPPYGTKPR